MTSPANSAAPDLGPALSTHTIRRAVRVRRLAFAGLFSLGALIALGVAVSRWLYAYGHYGPMLVWRWAAPALWVAVPVTFGTLIAWFGYLRTRRRIVSLHEGGLLLGRGRRAQPFQWGEVAEVYASSTRYLLPLPTRATSHTLWIVLRRGLALRFDGSWSDLEVLIEEVKRRVYPTLLAEYSQRFAAGQPLYFGPLTLTAEGVHHRKRLVRWAELRGARLGEGWLHIESNDRPGGHAFRLPVGRVPNVDLCWQLIQHLGSRP